MTAYGSLAGGVDPYNHRYKSGPFSVTWHRNGELIEERGHVTDLIAQEAVQWIEEQTGPWFCYVPFTAVHTPHQSTTTLDRSLFRPALRSRRQQRSLIQNLRRVRQPDGSRHRPTRRDPCPHLPARKHHHHLLIGQRRHPCRSPSRHGQIPGPPRRNAASGQQPAPARSEISTLRRRHSHAIPD